jgi:hypothetical protein
MKKQPVIPTPCPKSADGGPKEIFCALCKFHAKSVEAWNAEYKRKEHA